jgi:hypothetical protein
LIARKSHFENTDETDIGREETGIENHTYLGADDAVVGADVGAGPVGGEGRSLGNVKLLASARRCKVSRTHASSSLVFFILSLEQWNRPGRALIKPQSALPSRRELIALSIDSRN